MSKEDTKWRLRDAEGKEYIIIDSQKVDLQEELNKTIVKQMKEIERLKSINEEHRILNGELRRELEVEKDISDGMLKTIDKAIEYIENKNKYLDKENYYQVFEYRDMYLIPLLDILKGSDKE